MEASEVISEGAAMLLKNTNGWLKNINNRGVLFLIQRLDELTYPYTLDSYRVPTTNVPFLVRECIQVLSDQEDHDLNPAHVERIWEELESRMTGNFIASSLLKVPWEEYRKVDKKNLEALKGVLNVLSAELQPIRYLKRCFHIVQEIDPSKLEDLDLLAREIATTVVNCGIDVGWISQLLHEFFFKDGASEDEEVLEEFFTSLLPTRCDYMIHLTVKTDARNIRKAIRETFSIEFSNSKPGSLAACAEELSLGDGEVFISIPRIAAPDPMTALRLAKRNVARMHDLYGLFHHKGSYEIGPYALAIQCEEHHKVLKLRADVNRMEFIRDNRKGSADRKLEGLIQKVQLPIGKDSEKFFRVVDFHGMSLGSKVPENQLINLWTSLETIAPSQKGKSIIGSVVDGVVPFICLQYFSKIFTNLARDLKRWNNEALKDAFEAAAIPKDFMIAEKFFCLTVLKKHDAACCDLLGQMDDFPLLRNRVFTLNKSAQSGKKLGDWLTGHQRKVEQQIYRIYRSRNSIVHSASDTAAIENLIVSAHDYFDQVFSLSSEMCSKPNGFTNYADCFVFAKLLYTNYKSNISLVQNVNDMHVENIIWSYRKE